MESSPRDLLSDVAEHMPILKNNQNTYYPFNSTPKTLTFTKTAVLILVCSAHNMLLY